MELLTELESKSAPRIKSAASKISKGRLKGYEELLLAALTLLMQKRKSWQAQSEVIRAIGITGSKASIPYLKELEQTVIDSTVLYRDLGFSICLLEDIANGKLDYLKSILHSTNVLLLAGACSAILYSEFIPNDEDISSILNSVAIHTQDEGNIITPRIYIAAACYAWPIDLTREFLSGCSKSSWRSLVEISEDSLTGKKTKYVLV